MKIVCSYSCAYPFMSLSAARLMFSHRFHHTADPPSSKFFCCCCFSTLIYEFISCLYEADRATGFILHLISNQNFHPPPVFPQKLPTVKVGDIHLFGCLPLFQCIDCLIVPYIGLCVCVFAILCSLSFVYSLLCVCPRF